MAGLIKSHRDLDVYKTAMAAALAVSRLVTRFPSDEFQLKDQTRRSARAPGACIAEAWRKRQYPKYWINKLSEAQSESAEAQYWVELAWQEGYCTEAEFKAVFSMFEKCIGQLARMIIQRSAWTGHIKSRKP